MSAPGACGRPGGVHIGALATAVPAFSATQAEAGERFLAEYARQLRPRSVSLSRKLFAHPSIRKRHFAIETPEAFFGEGPDERIARFTRASVQLAGEAISHALGAAGLGPADVAALIVNTCTGYLCPGVSTYLLEALELPRSARVYDLVGSGCGGAVPNLELAWSLAGGCGGRAVVSASVEICSATMQVGDELSLLVSNALFGDGAAAAVVWARPTGLELVDSASRYVPEDRESIRYVHRGGQLHNQLSTDLPRLVARAVREVVDAVLAPRGLTVADVPHWAIHTGGEKIVDHVAAALGLTEAQAAPTRRVLAEFGNMSSPTVWFVLEEALGAGVEPGERCLMLAFGAGLSAHACLLRQA